MQKKKKYSIWKMAADSAGLPRRLPDFGICTCSHKGCSGSFNCSAAKNAVFGIDGCCCFFFYPTPDVLDELLRHLFRAAGLSRTKPAALFRLQRKHGGTGGIYLYAASVGALSCREKGYPHPWAIYERN